MLNEFWVMAQKQKAGADLSPSLNPAGHNMPPICIVELTQDEMVYVWPVQPDFKTLCMVCKNFKDQSSDTCHTDIPVGYPCRFEPVPEAVLSQDFDDFLIDGEYLSECGYFYSFVDFTRQNGYSDEDYYFCKIGIFPSIRGARQSFAASTEFLCGQI